MKTKDYPQKRTFSLMRQCFSPIEEPLGSMMPHEHDVCNHTAHDSFKWSKVATVMCLFGLFFLFGGIKTQAVSSYYTGAYDEVGIPAAYSYYSPEPYVPGLPMGTSYGIGYFNKDWTVIFYSDSYNMDNCKGEIVFLGYHGTSDDGWRQAEGGATIKYNGSIIANFYHTKDDGSDAQLVNKNSIIIDERLERNVAPKNYGTEHEYKDNTYCYQHVFIKIDADNLNKNIPCAVFGTYWRWSTTKPDEVVAEEPKNLNTAYTYTLGALTISSVNVDATGKLTMNYSIATGNANAHSTLNWSYKKDNSTASTILLNQSSGASVSVTANGTISEDGLELQGHTYTFSGSHSYSGTSSNTATYTFPGFPFPSVASGTFKMENGTVSLSWKNNNIGSTTGLDSYRAGKWRILRSDGSTTQAIADLDLTTTSYTDSKIDFDKNYTYTIGYVSNSWSNLGPNAVVSALAVATPSISTKRDISLTVKTKSQNKQVDLTISFYKADAGFYKKIEIYRDEETVANLKQTFTSPDGLESVTWSDVYSESNVLSTCTPHKYIVKVYQNNTNVDMIGKAEVSAAIKGGTTLLWLTASKGEYTGVVKLKWQAARADDDTSNDTYVISRRKAESGSAFTEINRSSSNEQYFTYTDEQAKAGTYYEYKVDVYLSCDNEKKVPSSSLTTVAYAQSVGTVAGRISYGSGTSVGGVQVSLIKKSAADTEQNSQQFHSLKFSNGGYATIDMDQTKIEKLFAGTNDFSIQMWVKPLADSTANEVFYLPEGLKMGFISSGTGKLAMRVMTKDNVEKPGQYRLVGTVSDFDIPVNQWSNITLQRESGYMVAYTVKSDSVKRYVVGKLPCWWVCRPLHNGSCYYTLARSSNSAFTSVKETYNYFSTRTNGVTYPAVITSADEMSYINGLGLKGAIGGYRNIEGSASDGKFSWVTGEEMTYTNWAASEPNNSNNMENSITISSTWNDIAWASISDIIMEIKGEHIALGRSELDYTEKGYNGLIDELRIWSKSLTQDEILRNYDHLLTGNESNLEVYCPMDEGLSKNFFDNSRTDNVSNLHHGTMKSGVLSDNDVPDVLALKSYTDKDGNYVITGVPYTGEGSTYAIVPLYGTHQFEPTQQLRYVSNNSLVHNGTDFTDISSFSIQGKVTYKYGTFPVEGAVVYVDGEVATKDGASILTNADGEYQVDVPIGNHFISVAMANHTFDGEGRFPVGKGVYYNFQKNLTGVNFTDNTTITIAGRVAGGEEQAALKVGFGKYTGSRANIGQAVLYLNPVTTKSYLLNSSENDSVLMVLSDSLVRSKTYLQRASRTGEPQIRIETDPNTGEFIAKLPPMNYQYAGGSTKSVDNTTLGVSGIAQLKPKLDTQVADTLVTQNGMLITQYNLKSIIKYISEPIFNISDYGSNEGAFGMKALRVNNDTTNLHTADLYTVDGNGNISYTLGYPVYQMSDKYYLGITATQKYVNNDGGNSVVTTVPLKGLEVSFANADWSINKGSFAENSGNYSDVITLDKNGKGIYSFNANYPNYASGDYTRTLQASYKINNKTYLWPDTPMKAIFLGTLFNSGENFITKGPDVVDFVLRDPPGSGSYSYLEKGSSYSSSTTVSQSQETATLQNFEFFIGFAAHIGKGVGVIEESDIKAEAGTEEEHSVTDTYENDTTTTSTVTTASTITTSDSEDYVGSMGDVFVGRSTNLIIGSSKKLGLFTEAPVSGSPIATTTLPNGTTLYFYSKDIVACCMQMGTTFAYDQNHIEGYLIPEIERTRNSLLLGPTTVESNIQWEPNDTIKYISKVEDSDETFGSNNSYTIVTNPALAGKKYTYNDQIVTYNNWIESWEKILSNNEQAKVKASYPNTYSFSAGTTREYSYTLDKNQALAASYAQVKFTSVLGGEQFECATGIGIEEKLMAGKSNQTSTGSSSESEKDNYATMGYVLADGDQGDFFSVSVSDTASTKEMFFRLNAGQSSCPYEGKEVTKYYLPGHYTISPGTYQIDKPELTIQEANLTDIPAGREGTLVLQLHNASEAHLSNTYRLTYEDKSNQAGLSLSIDGVPLTTEGRSVWLDDDETITKVLKVKQTKNDVMDYDNIKLYFTSSCQSDPGADVGWICSEKTFSVHFKPSCSDATLTVTDDQGNNINTINSTTGSTIILKASDYDVNFTGFKILNLQERSSNEANWKTIASYAVNDSIAKADNLSLVIGKNSTLTYNYDTKELGDQTYQFRIQTVGTYGSTQKKTVTAESEVLNIVKDMQAPQLLGNAYPVNGILTPEGEIGLQFNENIYTAGLVKGNLAIKGILNNQPLTHNTGLKFSGGAEASTEATIALGSTSFTIEMWLNRPMGEAATLLKHGTDSMGLSIGFTADNKLTLSMNGTTSTSIKPISTNDWQYLSVSYDRETGRLFAYDLYNDLTGTAHNDSLLGSGGVKVKTAYSGTGRLFLGKDYTGTIQELTLWNKARTMADMADKSVTKSGRETGLIGYWPMNECRGTQAVDKARSRYINLPSDSYWYISDENLAYHFDGTSNSFIIPSGNIPILSNQDFCLEFWFRSDTKGTSTLFSCGKGYGDERDHTGKLSIDATDGILSLHVLNNSYELGSTNRFDGNWHHLALNVRRSGTATVYIDNAAVKQLPASVVGDFTAGSMMLGACSYISNEGMKIDNFFKGEIDELRIWNASLTKENISLNSNSRLNGDEKGLVAYYPMEKSQAIAGTTVMETVASIEDRTGKSSGSSTNATSTTQAPMIKGVRTLEDVVFNWVASDNKIVLDVNMQPERIEGCTLEMTADYIKDRNGNTIQQPICWTAYVDINRLKWNDSDVDVAQEVLNSSTFQTAISNQSSSEETWVLSNVPSWLTVSKTQGTLKQLSTEKLTFTVGEETPIGSYEGIIYLKGNNSIAEPLHVSLTVTGKRPDWTVNAANFEGSMNLVSRLSIEGYVSEDKNDLVSAFINDTCVGVAQPIYVASHDAYLLMMDIYGNSFHSGKKVTFKAWDASTGRTYPTVALASNAGKDTTLLFAEGTITGTPALPYTLNAKDILQQTLPLKSGWNWLSMNVDCNEGMYTDTLFNDVKSKVYLVKSQKDGFVSCDTAGTWDTEASLYGKKLTNSQMYMAKMRGDATLTVVGSMVKPAATALTINTKWNWIGYTPQDAYGITASFAELDPQEGDVVKGQSQFAYFTSGQWVGTLGYMQPGHGYMYYSTRTATATFHYPSSYVTGYGIKSMGRGDNERTDFYWSCNYGNYPNNMTLIARVVKSDGSTLMEGDVAAFANDECRGVETIKSSGNVYLTVCGDNNTTLSFKVYDRATGEVTEVNSALAYTNNAMVGSANEPYLINLNPTDVKGVTSAINVYPKVVNEVVNVTAPEPIKKVILSNAAGVTQTIEGDGKTQAVISTGSLAKGVYIVTVCTASETVNQRIIKK